MIIDSVFFYSDEFLKKAREWCRFLDKHDFDFSTIEKIDMTGPVPVIFDKAGNKFSIDFTGNRQNYFKKKTSIKSELISKALGAGKYGFKVLDLSAGLGIDAVFLAQLGYEVTAIERNPLIYLALQDALDRQNEMKLSFVFGDSLDFLKSRRFSTEIIYFDPMFPGKTKSALPKQEMVFFRSLVGFDLDAAEILEHALQVPGVKRIAVKRPLKAEALLKTSSHIDGKLVRFDLYRGNF